jgi:ABC-type multidrug transport system fused ATPase/permease subunit
MSNNDSRNNDGLRNSISYALSSLAPRSRRQYFLLLLLRSSLAIVDLVAVVVVGIVVIMGTSKSGSTSNYGVFNNFIPDPSTNLGLGSLAAFALLLFAFKGIASLYIHNRTLRLLAREEVLFGQRATDLLFAQEISRLRLIETPTLSFALTHGVNSLIPRLLGFCGVAVTEIVSITILTIASIVFNPLGSLVALFVFVLLIGIFQISINNRLFRKGVSYSNAMIEQNASIRELVEAHREILVLKREDFFRSKLNCERSKAAELSSAVNFLVFIPRQVLEFSIILSAVAVGIVDYLQNGDAESLGAIGLFLATGSRVAPSFLALQGALGAMKQAIGESHTLRAALGAKGLPTYSNRVELKIDNSVSVDSSPQPVALQVKDLVVQYEGSDYLALNRVSFSVTKGQKVAIVGPSGAGKSTLVDAILGIIKPKNGRILLDGLSPSDFINESKGSVAYVPQSTTIIRGTILENIAFGLEIPTLSEASIRDAVVMAQLDSYIDSLPLGVHTMVGESGATLSGGQRQRLGIARALLSHPGLLILDEPSSALDSQTEEGLTQMLSTLSGGTTILIIAHRLSTIADADMVIAIENGTLVGKGTLQQLAIDFPHLINASDLSGTGN